MTAYDVVVIGGGPGGYVAAIKAAQLGKKAALVEKQWLGGVCLNIGCIPSKALLKNADVAHMLREGGREFGFKVEGLELDFPSAVKRSRQVSGRLTKGVGFLMKKHGIDVYMGTASFKDRSTLAVTLNDGGEEELKAGNIIIATGASSMIIPGMEPDGEAVLTYTEAILQEKLPKSVVIVGAGAIGLEFATIWNAYGSEITIVEMMPRIAPLEDEEASAEVEKAFKKRKITCLTGTKVDSIKKVKGGVKVTVTTPDGEQVLEAEQALVAIGFRPNSGDLGLDKVGVAVDKKGFIEINERMQTSVDGIWAIGDVTGKLMLAHVASAQGIICAENIAGAETITLNYDMMPHATYCHPQIASFGLTEAQAQEQGHDVKIGRFPFMANGKALGLGESSGWVKLVTDEKYGEILGAHMVGPEVTELLPELTLAQMMEITTAEISRNVHAHPTLSETLMEAAHAAEGEAIHI